MYKLELKYLLVYMSCLSCDLKTFGCLSFCNLIACCQPNSGSVRVAAMLQQLLGF